jgi:hypothetical protein
MTDVKEEKIEIDPELEQVIINTYKKQTEKQIKQS